MQTRIMQLEAMLAAAQDEIEERDLAIIELYNKYQEVVKGDASQNGSEAQSVRSNDAPVDRVRNLRKKADKSNKKKIVTEDKENEEDDGGENESKMSKEEQ